MPGEDLTKYIERVRKDTRKAKGQIIMAYIVDPKQHFN